MYVRFLFFTVGLLLLSLGISFTIIANIGAGPWDALSTALAANYGLTIGSWNFIISIILVSVNALIQKNRLDFFALFTGFLLSLSIDFWMFTLGNTFLLDTVLKQLLLLFVGIVVISIGTVLYIQPNFSPSAIDNFMLSLHKRFHMQLRNAKWTGEAIALLLASLLHGPVNVGTFLVALFVGPIIQFLIPYIEELYSLCGGKSKQPASLKKMK